MKHLTTTVLIALFLVLSLIHSGKLTKVFNICEDQSTISAVA